MNGIVCARCGHGVEAEKVLTDYPFYCPNCDENLFAFETVRLHLDKESET